MLASLDIVLIAVYLLAIVAIGIYQGTKRRQQSSRAETYFLAGREMSWIAIGSSLFASNIGSEHFIGLAGTGATVGLVVGAFEWQAPFMLILLAYFFVPVYLQSKIKTTPEWLSKRFSWRCRTYFALLSMIIYIFTKISVTIYAGGIILKAVLGWSLLASSIILVATTGLYVMIGGLKAVIYTELLQTAILIVGGLTLLCISLKSVGGFHILRERLEDRFFHMFLPYNDPLFPWIGVVFGMPLTGIYYWCTDQVIVQRVLSAKSIYHAKFGCVFAGFLKTLPVFMMVVPGMISSVLFPKEVSENSNIAYPLLVLNLMPTGLLGLIVASMLSALMSSLASVFNSASTIIAYDIYARLRPESADSRLVLIGRISCVGMFIVSTVWIFVVDRSSAQLFIYIQEMSAYLQPPVAAVFLLGMFWNRTNESGAIAGFIVGFLIGFSRLVLGYVYLNSNSPPAFVSLNFLIFGIILFVTSCFAIITVSLGTPKPAESKIIGLTWWTRHQNILSDLTSEKSPIISTRSDSSVSEMGTLGSGQLSLETNESVQVPDNSTDFDNLRQRELMLHEDSSHKNINGDNILVDDSYDISEAGYRKLRFVYHFELFGNHYRCNVVNVASLFLIFSTTILWIVYR